MSTFPEVGLSSGSGL